MSVKPCGSDDADNCRGLADKHVGVPAFGILHGIGEDAQEDETHEDGHDGLADYFGCLVHDLSIKVLHLR